MPAVPYIVSDQLESTEIALKKNLELSLSTHLAQLTRVTMERRRQGLRAGSKNRSLAEGIEVKRGVGETDTELIESIVREVIDRIIRDADGEAWRGTIILWNDKAPKAKDQELQRIDVTLDDPEAAVTRESETVALLSATAKFHEGMCKQFVAILGATAAREQAMADMVTGVAKHVANESGERAKWDYKMQKSRERMDAKRVEEEASVMRSKKRWDSISTIATEWTDIIEIWSEYFTHRKPGDPAMPPMKVPTQDQIDRVFEGEAFDVHRATASEMIVTVDKAARMRLAKRFRAAMEDMPPADRDALKVRAIMVFGNEADIRAVLAWLAMPLIDP